jgi:hypothetical protein
VFRESSNKVYIGIAFFIIAVIIFAVFFSNIQIIPAYIENKYLGDNWIEDDDERYNESKLLGLEQIISFTYIVSENINRYFPSYLTVTTLKTFFMMNEDELLEKTRETIESTAMERNISLDPSSKITGNRLISNGHKTMYTVYEGFDNSSGYSEKINIIGETWNCGTSGTSIICIGYAQITDKEHGKTEENLTFWAEIVQDKEGTFRMFNRGDNELIFQGVDGLIYNVKCH